MVGSDRSFRVAPGDCHFAVDIDTVSIALERQPQCSTRDRKHLPLECASLFCSSLGEMMAFYHVVRWLLLQRQKQSSGQQHVRPAMWRAIGHRSVLMRHPEIPQRKESHLVNAATAVVALIMIGVPTWREWSARSAARRRVTKLPPLTLPDGHSNSLRASACCSKSSPRDDEYVQRLDVQKLRHAQYRLQLQAQVQQKQKKKQKHRQKQQDDWWYVQDSTRSSCSSHVTNLLEEMDGNTL